MKMINLSMLLLMFVSFNSCKKEGCTDADAENYDSEAIDNDGSCQYKGDLTFWTKTGPSTIDVTVNGITSTITTTYAAAPGCDANGCANFTIPSGNYSYHAVDNAV